MTGQVSSTRKLVSASALMASGTLISRVLGLARVMLVAFILGNSTRQADIYSLATMVPNSLYILFAGGALNTVLVPQIVRAIKNDDDGGEAYINRIMTAFLLIVGVVAVIVTIAAPVVTWIYSGPNWHAPELANHYQGMVTLTALCLPQIFFYGMFFLFAQVLNARDKFGPMMWAPIVNNIISILVMVVYLIVWGRHTDHTIPFSTSQLLVLGIGSTLGIIAQALVLIPFMRKVGFTYKPRFDLKGTGLRHTFVLTKWTIGFVAVNQLALIVVQKLATSATAHGEGAGSAIYANAHLLWILPHSLITVSLATAMLPNSSRLAASGDLKGVADECVKTTRLALVLLVPAAVGFIALALPIAKLLFGHGAAASGVPLLAWTLVAFAVGLVPFTIQYVCLRTFYALENTRTPFYLQCAIAGLNAGLALVLVLPFDAPNWVAPGLALAYSLSYLVGVALSLQKLRVQLPQLNVNSIVRHTTQLFVAAVVGGLPAYFAGQWLSSTIGGTLGNLVAVLGGLAVMGLLYFAVAKLLHVSELNGLIGLLKRRFGRGRSAPANADPEADLDDISEILPAVDTHGDDLLGGERLFDDEAYRRPPQRSDDWDAPTTVRPARALADSEPRFEPTINEERRIVESGDVLAGRYRLEDKLMRRVETETWRAFDQVLSRLVLVQIMPAGAPRIDEVLSAARKGAIATDSRFLRVLDAVAVTPDPDNPSSLSNRVGAFVVSEYAPGQSLEELLQTGPLSALEAAWIVRELADALSTMHAQGLFHEQLNPDTVVITASGNVKIVGFGIESALTGPWDEGRTWSQREAGDVKALGKLLYATLVRRWPGSAGWHLKAAPVDEQGDVLTPRQVRAGVSPVLDAVCDQVLSDRPRHNEAPLRTASQIVVALTKVLGTADASNDLAHRLRYPVDPVSDPSGEDPALDDTATQPIAIRFVEHDDGELDPNRPLEISPPALRTDPAPEPPSRRWLLVLVAMVITTLVIALAWVAVDAARRERGQAPVGGPTAAGPATAGASPDAAAAIAITAAQDFDPKADGGNDEENPTSVGAAIDGKPDTGWSSLGYKSANFGKLKPGVGLVLDLGEARTFSRLRLTLAGEPTGIEIRVPSDEAASAAPMTSVKQWRVVAANKAAPAQADLTLEAPATSRFVLVYVTSLPQRGGTYPFRATINGVEVFQ